MYNIRSQLRIVHPSGHVSEMTIHVTDSADFIESLTDILPADSVDDVNFLNKVKKLCEIYKEIKHAEEP